MTEKKPKTAKKSPVRASKKSQGTKTPKSPKKRTAQSKAPKKSTRKKTIKCKECKKVINAMNPYGHPKVFCDCKCSNKWTGREVNRKYFESTVEDILFQMLKDFQENPDVMFIDELIANQEFWYQRVSEWIKEYSDNATVTDTYRNIKKLCEIRQVRAGMFEWVVVEDVEWHSVPVYRAWASLWDKPDEWKFVKRTIEKRMTVNSSFMKFTLMNHHEYRNKEDTQNKNLNHETRDLDDVIDTVWQNNEQDKKKSDF